ncbi:hypothetical protein BV25DRAFT_1021759 [Artomyces pyxidatus]|uniref:Uncharacterized protein n=1 Tax=Artomyces pyxidatus TaxID=48021 RepID=A0ACB8SV41_9AGAM|nr:hypothetical protein BV25DRAFT_1021759 [Artomyces pyxidatus]
MRVDMRLWKTVARPTVHLYILTSAQGLGYNILDLRTMIEAWVADAFQHTYLGDITAATRIWRSRPNPSLSRTFNHPELPTLTYCILAPDWTLQYAEREQLEGMCAISIPLFQQLVPPLVLVAFYPSAVWIALVPFLAANEHPGAYRYDHIGGVPIKVLMPSLYFLSFLPICLQWMRE